MLSHFPFFLNQFACLLCVYPFAFFPSQLGYGWQPHLHRETGAKPPNYYTPSNNNNNP